MLLALTIALAVILVITSVLLIVLILMLVGAIPSWAHSKSWGYTPSGVLGLVVATP